MRLTTTAANSSYTLCNDGSDRSPMKKPKFRVAANSTKKPKITFSRLMRGSRRRRFTLARRPSQRSPAPVSTAAVRVTADSTGLVPHMGAALLRILADRAGLPAAGGETIVDIDVRRHQEHRGELLTKDSFT